jgi:hypothetical protein
MLPALAAVAAVTAAILTASALGGTGINDSGWSVAKPSTVLDEHPSNDPTMRIAINHVLEQSKVPLLRSPAPGSSPMPHGQQSKDADGWRPVEIRFGHPTETAAPPMATLGEPISVAPEAECGERDDGTPPEQNQVDGTAVAETVLPDDNSMKASQSSENGASTSQPPATIANDESADGADQPQSGGNAFGDSLRKLTTSAAATSPAAKKSAAEPATETSAPQSVTVQRVPLSEESPPERRRPELTPLVEPLKAPLPPMSKNMQNLRNKVRTVLKMYYNKPLNSRDNDTWEMMHGMLAYGLRSQVRQGGPKGDLITAVGWLCYNKPCKGLTLMYVTPEGDLRAKQGAGLQGHMGQLLAMLAQCQVSPDYPIKVGEHDFTIRDLIEVEKKTCYEKTELTFKLIGLMHYLDSDEKWVNDQGMEWDIPKLISEELAQPIRGAACGGTHRLSGLSLAARTRVRRGEPLDGEFLKANEFVEKYHNYAFQLQNSDGSMSTEWFRGKGDDDDTDRRVKTTGHILEWLCYSLSDDQMRSGRVFAATNYLASLLYSNYDHEWEKGPIGHAIHALRLYDERMLQPYDNADNVASDAPSQNAPTRSKSRAQKR